MKIIFKLTASLFALGGIIHWLIILGVLSEKAPALVQWYFHSLAIVDLLVAYGLWYMRRWAILLGLWVAVTQLGAHTYMIYRDVYDAYGSGVSVPERIIDIVLSLLYILVFKRFFFNRSSPRESMVHVLVDQK